MYESVAKLPCGKVTVAKLPCGKVTSNRCKGVRSSTGISPQVQLGLSLVRIRFGWG